MDQKFVVEGGRFTAVLLFFCAFIVTPLGFGCLFSYPDQIWPVGLLFLICAGVFIRGGIQNLKRSKRMQAQLDTYNKNISQELAGINRQALSAAGQTALQDKVNILARWTYTDKEWKAYLVWETKKRALNSTIEAALIVVVGTVFVQMMREGGWGLSLALSVGVASIYWCGKYFLSMSSIGKASGKTNEIIVLPDTVVINGKYNAFKTELYRLQKINFIEDAIPMIMEIVYEWETRKGTTHDEIRIPIPEGKLQEARNIAASLSWI